MIYDFKAECVEDTDDLVIEITIPEERQEYFTAIQSFLKNNMFMVVTKIGLDYTYIVLSDIDMDDSRTELPGVEDFFFMPVDIVNLNKELNNKLSNSNLLNFRAVLTIANGKNSEISFSLDKHEGGLIKYVR